MPDDAARIWWCPMNTLEVTIAGLLLDGYRITSVMRAEDKAGWQVFTEKPTEKASVGK